MWERPAGAFDIECNMLTCVCVFVGDDVICCDTQLSAEITNQLRVEFSGSHFKHTHKQTNTHTNKQTHKQTNKQMLTLFHTEHKM